MILITTNISTVIMKMLSYEAFACRCGAGDVVLRELYKPKPVVNYTMHVHDQRASTTPGYSLGPSTTPSYSPGPSTPPRYSSRPLRNAECANCTLLVGKLQVLQATLEMYMHPEKYTIDSTTVLHELYNDMANRRTLEKKVDVEGIRRLKGEAFDGENYFVLAPHGLVWIRDDHWQGLIKIWNGPQWREKSRKVSQNRNTKTDGSEKETGGPYGSDKTKHPTGDMDLWNECTRGRIKGRTFGTSSLSLDPHYVVTGIPSTRSSCNPHPHCRGSTSMSKVTQLEERMELQKQEHVTREDALKKEFEDHEVAINKQREEDHLEW
ncbi:hypothetical protein Tco_0575010 [Tanacetum coccineum]